MRQSSCSELLVDTVICDPEKALKKFLDLFKEVGWDSSPPLTLELLIDLKEKSEKKYASENYDIDIPDILVFDDRGNQAYLEYGGNGYITTGYRFDSHCNHGNVSCYPIFFQAIQKLGGTLHSCDGGSTDYYEQWEKGIMV